MSRIIVVRVHVQAILGLASLRATDTVAHALAGLGHVQGMTILSLLTALLSSMSLLTCTVIVSFQALHFAVG